MKLIYYTFYRWSFLFSFNGSQPLWAMYFFAIFVSSRDFVRSFGLLAHENKEQSEYQRGSKAGYNKDHDTAIKTAENLVNGSVRLTDVISPSFKSVSQYIKTLPDGSTGIIDIMSGLLNFQYLYQGKIRTIAFQVERNNIIGLY